MPMSTGGHQELPSEQWQVHPHAGAGCTGGLHQLLARRQKLPTDTRQVNVSVSILSHGQRLA
eukprot:2343298-Pyramimonas_sp.AAC.1